MCTQPLIIRNKRCRSLSVPFARQFVKVPCGVCDECLRKRAKDLYLRARFEIENAIADGGCAFMCTLTYDNFNVPKFGDAMVFNKKDVILFIKRLRTNLDRFYKKHYGCSAPDFKYLVTSEFGTNPYASHRPHYHALFSFFNKVSLYVFRMCFEESLYNKKTGIWYFGKVFQCDLLDLSRGGIRYSTKYILKDSAYNKQDIHIRETIKFYTDYVNKIHGIISAPISEDDFFHNKCIRSNKEYKKDIERFVLPYRHMLQFYMCSNDYGVSAILNRYGENIYSLGLLNIDGLPYSIPKSLIQRVERNEGSVSRDIIAKTVFLSQFRNAIEDVVSRNLIPRFRCEMLYQFAKDFLQPRYGSLYFISPFSDFYIHYGRFALDEFITTYEFYDNNGFIALRNDVYSIINLSNSPSSLKVRAILAHNKSCKEREEYLRKKFNKSYYV